MATHPNGELSLVPGNPAQAQDGGGGPVAITPDSKLLYTTNIYALVAYQINADGSLTNASIPSITTSDPSYGLVAHPTAGFLYASSGSGVLSVFTIDSQTGALNLTSSVSLPDPVANSAVLTPNGRFLYQDCGQYAPGTGALTPVPGSPFVAQRPCEGPTADPGCSAEIAAELIIHACREGNFDPKGLVLHSDNGKPMRASTFVATLQWLGVIPFLQSTARLG